MLCPVALLADVLTWVARAGALLMVRLTSAVALSATAFSLALLATEHPGTNQSAAMVRTIILSDTATAPVISDTAPIRVAAAR